MISFPMEQITIYNLNGGRDGLTAYLYQYLLHQLSFWLHSLNLPTIKCSSTGVAEWELIYLLEYPRLTWNLTSIDISSKLLMHWGLWSLSLLYRLCPKRNLKTWLCPCGCCYGLLIKTVSPNNHLMLIRYVYLRVVLLSVRDKWRHVWVPCESRVDQLTLIREYLLYCQVNCE